MSTHAHHAHGHHKVHESREAVLDRRLEDIGWGLFFVLIGAIWFLPANLVPDGVPLMAVGLLLLALNVVRWLKGIPIHVLSTALGVLALAGGIGELLDAQLELLPLFLLVVGAGIVLKPLLERKT